MNKVAIVGVGMTKFGLHYDKSLVDLAVEAGTRALDDAGLSSEEVKSMYVGTMSSGLFLGQENLASLIADQTRLTLKPGVRIEAACASGAVAFRQGYMDVLSGMSDVVVVGGVEKMTDLETTGVTKTLATAASQEWEVLQGATFPSLYAMMATLHMNKFKTTREQLAAVAVKNHKNAVNNPYAQFRKEITVNDVLNSAPIADPLRLLDCAPISDGAAVVILCSEKKALSICDTPVWIKGSGQATDTLSLHDRKDLLTLGATVQAARQAYSQANMQPSDIHTAEVHDGFTITELIGIEDLGFVKKGDSGIFTLDGNTEIGGKIAVNASGGLKARGHPVGASGLAQAVEAVLQLRSEYKQKINATNALIHSVGGTGGTAAVHILSRES